MRLFIAVAFDGPTQSKIAGLYDELRRAGVTGSFTPAGNLHLTLKFLGEVGQPDSTSVRKALFRAAQASRAFTLKAGRCGFFSSRGSKTLWLGIYGDGLAELALCVDTELSKVGFEREKRDFTPHVTLARRACCDEKALSLLDIPEISMNVERATLFESRRDGGHLWYKPLYSANLTAIKI